MRKTIGFVLLSFILCSPLFAQNLGGNSLRQDTVSLLVDYGTKLYERRDFAQAEVVFKRVLAYDPNQKLAKKYLHLINPTQPIEYQPVKSIVIPKNTVKVIANKQDLSVQELKQRIAQKEEVVDDLKNQLKATNSISRNDKPAVVDNPDEFSAYLDSLREQVKQLRQQVDSKRQQINTLDKQINP